MPKDPLSEIKDLVRIVSTMGPERLQYLSRTEIREGNSQNASFVRALIENPRLTENELSQKLFQASPSDGDYQKVKSRTRKLLLNSIFVLDLKEADKTKASQMGYFVRISAFLARTLLQWDCGDGAQSIADYALPIAMEYELWHDAMDMLCCLRDLAAYSGDVKKLKEYALEYERIAVIEIAQQRSLAHFAEIMAPFARTGSELPDLAPLALEYLREAEKDYERYRTYGLAANVFRLRTGYYGLLMDYGKILAACDEYEGLLLGKFNFFSLPSRLGEIRVKRVMCHLHLGSYEEGVAAAETCKEVITEGSDNWFYCRQYEFLCYSNAIRFDEAEKVVEEIRNHERFSRQDEYLQERWKLYKMYLDYLRGTTSTMAQSRNARAILKATPLHKNDKAGLNALVYLLHMLLLLERTDKIEAINQMDAFRMYRSRNLDQDKFPAMTAFFKLLVMLEQVEFDPVRAEAKEQVILKELHAAKEDVSAGLQVVPYEWLWRKILEHLKLHPMV